MNKLCVNNNNQNYEVAVRISYNISYHICHNVNIKYFKNLETMRSYYNETRERQWGHYS